MTLILIWLSIPALLILLRLNALRRRDMYSRREHTPPNAAGDEGRAAASDRPAICQTHTHADHFDCTAR